MVIKRYHALVRNSIVFVVVSILVFVLIALYNTQPQLLVRIYNFPWSSLEDARVQYAIGGAAPEDVPLSPEDFREIVSVALVVPDRPSNAMPSAYFYLYTWDENGAFADCGVGPAGEIILGVGGEHHCWREPEPAAYAALYELAFGAP